MSAEFPVLMLIDTGAPVALGSSNVQLAISQAEAWLCSCPRSRSQNPRPEIPGTYP